ncbi:MAG TPA: SDR family oxidoreductase [Methylomirabilota bacterium]|jgi:NAD(P)-dependent dehydrogenase (short-subunit alcohol dehydrogenase family)|nr:SDR family oxidoreductase [Methylomirabilota bacterium]
MPDRLKGKIAIVVGAGQTPGDTIGNGRASAILYAREGAKVIVVDRRLDSAEETCQMIAKEGGEAIAFQADAIKSDDCQKMAETCVQRFGRIDILHNNVGIGDNDGGLNQVTEEAWDRIMAVNMKSVIMPCKHVIPIMRGQRSGAILNISSIAAVCNVGILAYKTSKAGVNAITNQLALSNAKYGIRVNCIMPGLMDTPMAIEGISRARGIAKEQLRKERDAMVPLLAKMGTGWDIAYAALFLNSDEAKFITGVILPVDGGQSAKIG